MFHLDAIGASVTVGRQTRRVQAGSGFLSQHSKELLFGLGEARGPVSATIRWPGGAVQELKDLPINHRIYLKEGTPPRIEAFAVARPLRPSKARRAEPLPAAFETLLLAPVPMPQTRSDAVMSILFRYLFDRRREIPPGARFEIDETGLLTKVSLGQARDARLPGNSETYVCGRNYLSLGSVYFQRGLLEPAEHFFTLALKDDPSSAEAYYGLGSVYLKLDRRDEARANFEQALKANAGYRDTGPNAWNNLGLLATRDGRLDEAVRCFKEALKLSPDYWISLENLGNAYRQMGRPAEARTALERALALNPRDPGSNYSLGMVFAQTGDAGQAEQYLTKALALKPDYPEALNTRILYLRTNGAIWPWRSSRRASG